MARGNFDNMKAGKAETGTSGGRIYARTERGNQKKGSQTMPSADERLERANSMKTQGRKGCKLSRINMAFTPANHAFLKVMAHSTGMTITEFTNYVIDRYRVEHPEIYDRAKEFIEIAQSVERLRNTEIVITRKEAKK